MGQAQSDSSAAAVDETLGKPQESSSMESLIAEAAAYGDSGESESLDSKAEKALECPCISELRNGECGAQFSDAFLCFLKSTSEAKGSDCVHPFVALQNCIKANPGAFSRGEEKGVVTEEEEAVQKYKISAPLWAREPSIPKPKL